MKLAFLEEIRAGNLRRHNVCLRAARGRRACKGACAIPTTASLQKTAGFPRSRYPARGLTDVITVVTRYFGGSALLARRSVVARHVAIPGGHRGGGARRRVRGHRSAASGVRQHDQVAHATSDRVQAPDTVQPIAVDRAQACSTARRSPAAQDHRA